MPTDLRRSARRALRDRSRWGRIVLNLAVLALAGWAVRHLVIALTIEKAPPAAVVGAPRPRVTISGLLPVPSESSVTGVRPTGPPPPDTWLLDVVNDDVVYRAPVDLSCVRPAPALLATANAGRSWLRLDVPLIGLTAMSFADARHGTVVGWTKNCKVGAWNTSDAGASWHPIASPARPVIDLDLVTENDGWAVTRIPAGIARVTGGGTSLTPTSTPCGGTASPPRRVVAVSTSEAIVTCEGDVTSAGQARGVYRTTNGGASWTAMTRSARGVAPGADGLGGAGRLLSLDRVGDELLVAISKGGCPEGELRRSRDGGRTWTATPCVSAEIEHDGWLGVGFSTAGRGFGLVAWGSQLRGLVTADGGATWQLVQES